MFKRGQRGDAHKIAASGIVTCPFTINICGSIAPITMKFELDMLQRMLKTAIKSDFYSDFVMALITQAKYTYPYIRKNQQKNVKPEFRFLMTYLYTKDCSIEFEFLQKKSR